MSKTRNKEFDVLKEIPFGYRPQILLTGNGMSLSFSGATDVDNMVCEEWKTNYGTEITSNPKTHPIWELPFPMQIEVATKTKVQSSMNNLANSFKKQKEDLEQSAFLRQVLDVGFDSVLTTNYSLEFERSTISDCTPGKVFRQYLTTQEQTKQQEQFGIFQCTSLLDENKTKLWHIHGTALRKKSMIIGQLYYGMLLTEIVQRARKVARVYKKSQTQERPYTPMSWIDYFLISDIYIMGFKLAISESDLWWLISYKKKTFPSTGIYFYDKRVDEDFKILAECYDINMPSIPFDESDKKAYIEFYKRVCKDIKSRKS